MSAFLVDCNQKPGFTQVMDFGYQCIELPQVLEIAREQNDTTNRRMAQNLSFFKVQLDLSNTHHDWP